VIEAQRQEDLANLLPVFAAGAAIPKTIHQIYFGQDPRLPAALQQNVDRILACNPGWAHQLYDDRAMAEFIRTNYGARILSYYLRINEKYGAARADLFRYLLMYQQGGVYLDIKASLERPLDDVLRPDEVFVLARWRDTKGELYERWGMHRELRKFGGKEFQQWHIIAAPGHPFLRAVILRVLANIDAYSPLWHGIGKNGVLWLTGPVAYTLAITPLLAQNPHRLLAGHDELGLVYSVFKANAAVAHRTMFKYHYAEMTEPVAAISGPTRLLWAIFGPLQIHVLGRAGRIVEALARRARRLGLLGT